MFQYFSDKPGPPEGPLVVDEVFADSCRLSWKPPVDDGNAPVSGYFTCIKIIYNIMFVFG